jgi:hypothetical protein
MSKFITIDELLAEETPQLRKQIARRSKEAIKAERLRQLRELAGKTQHEIAGIRQEGVSRLEKRNDMLLSSLNAYVRGLGGTLKLVADLPNVGPVELELTRQATVKGAASARRARVPTPLNSAKPKRKSA